MDLFVYAAELRLIYCRPCQHALLLDTVPGHMRGQHVGLVHSAAEREQIKTTLQASWPDAIRNETELAGAKMPVRCARLQYLTLHRGGFACDVKACGHISTSISTTRLHFSDVHNGLKIRWPGKENADPSGTGAANVRLNAAYHTLFKTGPGRRFIEVSTAETDDDDDNTAAAAAKDDGSIRRSVTGAFDTFAGCSDAAVEMMDKYQYRHCVIGIPEDINEWLNASHWPRYFADFDRPQLRLLLGPPGAADEPALTEVWSAWPPLLERCEQRLSGVSATLRTAVRAGDIRPPTGPLEPYKTGGSSGSLAKAIRYWRQMTILLYRRHRDGDAWTGPKIPLARAQTLALNNVLACAREAVAAAPAIRHPDRDDGDGEEEHLKPSTHKLNLARDKLKLGLMNLVTALLQQRIDRDDYDVALVCAMAFLGLRPLGRNEGDRTGRERGGVGAWLDYSNYSSILSSVIRSCRVLLLTEVLDFPLESMDSGPGGEDESALDRIRRTTRRLLSHNSGNAWGWAHRLRRLAMRLNENRTSEGAILYDVKREHIRWRDVDFTLPNFREMVHRRVAEARRILHTELLFQPADDAVDVDSDLYRDEIRIAWHELHERHDEKGVGVNFTNFIGSPLARVGPQRTPASRWLIERRLAPELRLYHGAPFWRPDGELNRNTARLYLSRVDAFLEILLFLMHVTGGQPARGPELLSIRLANTEAGKLRNILLEEGGIMMFVTRYHKAYNVTRRQRVIQRFLPRPVGELLLLYIRLVFPFRDRLRLLLLMGELADRERGGGDPVLIKAAARARLNDFHTTRYHLWSDWRLRGRIWSSERLTKVLRETTASELGASLGIRAYRHMIIAITRFFFPHTFPDLDSDRDKDDGDDYSDDDDDDDYDDDDDDGGNNNNINRRSRWYCRPEIGHAFDLQAAHSTATAFRVYGRGQEERYGESGDMKRRFLLASKALHRFLGFARSGDADDAADDNVTITTTKSRSDPNNDRDVAEKKKRKKGYEDEDDGTDRGKKRKRAGRRRRAGECKTPEAHSGSDADKDDDGGAAAAAAAPPVTPKRTTQSSSTKTRTRISRADRREEGRDDTQIRQDSRLAQLRALKPRLPAALEQYMSWNRARHRQPLPPLSPSTTTAAVDFRPGQHKMLNLVLEGESPLLYVAATGMGKSLAYMLPVWLTANMIDDAGSGLTVVVVPLRSLMQDIEDKCRAKCIGCTRWTAAAAAPVAVDGRHLVLVTPEAADGSSFRTWVTRQATFGLLDRVVVDECHLMLNNRTDFRRSFRALAWLFCTLRAQLLFLTATLPPARTGELARLAGLVGPGDIAADVFRQVRVSSCRPNITYIVDRPSPQTIDDIGGPATAVARFIDYIRGQTRLMPARFVVDGDGDGGDGGGGGEEKVIIYVKTRLMAEDLARSLAVPYYHAGITDDAQRTSVLTRLMTGQVRCVVATTALGMGLDIPDIRAVIHLGRPFSMLDFAQESGRAGRDGKPAYSIVIDLQPWLPKSEGDDDINVGIEADNETADNDDVRYIAVEDRALHDYLDNRPATHSSCHRAVLERFLDGEATSTCLSRWERQRQEEKESRGQTNDTINLSFGTVNDASQPQVRLCRRCEQLSDGRSTQTSSSLLSNTVLLLPSPLPPPPPPAPAPAPAPAPVPAPPAPLPSSPSSSSLFSPPSSQRRGPILTAHKKGYKVSYRSVADPTGPAAAPAPPVTQQIGEIEAEDNITAPPPPPPPPAPPTAPSSASPASSATSNERLPPVLSSSPASLPLLPRSWSSPVVGSRTAVAAADTADSTAPPRALSSPVRQQYQDAPDIATARRAGERDYLHSLQQRRTQQSALEMIALRAELDFWRERCVNCCIHDGADADSAGWHDLLACPHLDPALGTRMREARNLIKNRLPQLTVCYYCLTPLALCTQWRDNGHGGWERVATKLDRNACLYADVLLGSYFALQRAFEGTEVETAYHQRCIASRGRRQQQQQQQPAQQTPAVSISDEANFLKARTQSVDGAPLLNLHHEFTKLSREWRTRCGRSAG